MKATKLAKSIFAAADEYIKLRDRVAHPVGEFDKQGRFSLTTRCECCVGIRSPSKRYPYSQMTHGRSFVHVATAAGLPQYTKAVKAIVGVIDRKGVEAISAYLVSKTFLKLLDACAAATAGLDLEEA